MPPLAFLGAEPRIAGLRYRRAENIEAANIHCLPGFSAEALVQLLGILAGELSHAANAEQLKIAKHGRADGNEICEAAWIESHKFLLDDEEKIVLRFTSLV
jgi:hypothetical protein